MDHRDRYATRGVREREAGLRRIGVITRAALVGSLTLTGAVAVAAARSFPGHTTKAKTAAVSSSTSASGSSSSSTASAGNQSSSTQSVQPAASTPTASSAAPVTSSGGS